MASIIVVDNFFSDPYYVREQAFKMDWFDQMGNHPGKRTKGDNTLLLKTLENQIGEKY